VRIVAVMSQCVRFIEMRDVNNKYYVLNVTARGLFTVLSTF